MNQNGTAPHNVEAEQSLLGSVIIDTDRLIETQHRNITERDFFITRNGWVWDALKGLQERGASINLVSLTDELEARGKLDEMGGAAYLTEIINATPTSIHADYYAEMVKRDSVLRQLIDAAAMIAKIAYNGKSEQPADILQQASEILMKVQTGNVTDSTRTLKDLANAVIDRLERTQETKNAITGIPSGLKGLDRMTNGWQQGDLVILAGAPGMGKTAFATQCILEAAKTHGARGMIFSREMSGEALMQRLIAFESTAGVGAIRSGNVPRDKMGDVLKAADELSRLPFVIDDHSATPEAIRARCILQQAQYGLDFVVVDYIQRLSVAGNQNRTQEVGKITRGLKSIALDLGVPVIAISSLSRNFTNRPDKRPQLSDLRESGDIEYDADLVLFLFREEEYNPDTDIPGVTELNIAKHRMGETGVVSLFFKKALTRFYDLDTNTVSLDWVK